MLQDQRQMEVSSKAFFLRIGRLSQCCWISMACCACRIPEWRVNLPGRLFVGKSTSARNGVSLDRLGVPNFLPSIRTNLQRIVQLKCGRLDVKEGVKTWQRWLGSGCNKKIPTALLGYGKITYMVGPPNSFVLLQANAFPSDSSARLLSVATTAPS
jgi:hypothetical protein